MPSYFPIAQPSMAMNDVRAPKHWLRFANTLRVEANAPVDDCFKWAAQVMAPWHRAGKRNISLAINCHGLAQEGLPERDNVAGLFLGKNVTTHTVSCFSHIKPYCETIYLTSCKSGDGASGNHFCSRVATLAAAFVLAGEDDQFAGTLSPEQLPYGVIPVFQGKIKKFDKTGKLIYYGPFDDPKIFWQNP